ncbi:MAG: cytochrome c biogenesis protein CcsA [Verrucomicrobia bacterium]|nr:cytochrome c biogenesis protein CcsA [Verrucomicrobiota bacterium]
MKKWLPLILTGAMAVWFLGTLRAPAVKDFDYGAFGRLPVVFNGRHQPMDSIARNSLLQIREKQSANLEPWKGDLEKPRIIPAIEWLVAVMTKPAVADEWPVFRIDNPELTALLKLPEKDKEKECDGKHYSWKQIEPSLDVMQEQSTRIGGREQRKESEAGQRTPFERAVMKLHDRLVLYMRLKNTLQPQDARDWSKELAEYESLLGPGVAAIQAQQAKEKYDEAVFKKFVGYAQKFDAMARLEPPLVVPPHAHDGAAHGDWTRVGEALIEAARGESLPGAVRHYAAMAGAFQRGDADDFNQQVAAYRASLAPGFATELTKSGREVFFNRMQAFYNAMVIYVLAGLLACASWFNRSDWLRRSAVWLIGLALIIHTTGLIFRMVLEGRPPVTNLYSSAIFIGWGACVLGLVLERFYKDGIGAVVSSSVGFLTLIVAHHLALIAEHGDTMEMMRAVLDTNFWLATHVVAVTTGYASTFVAGFLAIVYIVRGMFTKTLDEATGKGLSRMVYGIVCFATLFSFVGTVLGGIWADQSWGRFWGWDPKENGALIIVLWNALILHLRWGGMIRERGLINCAIVGNIVTSWSWFGVNMLGIGLHSYGFMDSAFKWLMGFVVSQLALIALGLLPDKCWASFRNRPPMPPAAPSRKEMKPGKRDKGRSKLAPA